MADDTVPLASLPDWLDPSQYRAVAPPTAWDKASDLAKALIPQSLQGPTHADWERFHANEAAARARGEAYLGQTPDQNARTAAAFFGPMELGSMLPLGAMGAGAKAAAAGAGKFLPAAAGALPKAAEAGKVASMGDTTSSIQRMLAAIKADPNAVAADRVLIDRDAFNEAASTLRNAADPKAIPALDPAKWDWTNKPVVLRADGSVLDGNHRIIGVAKWMQEHGMDLDNDFHEIPALRVSREMEETHPRDESTPNWWVDSLIRSKTK